MEHNTSRGVARRLLAALDAMPEDRRELHTGAFFPNDEGPECCAVGALFLHEGCPLKDRDMTWRQISGALGTHYSYLLPIARFNDSHDDTPTDRWTRMRQWAAERSAL